MRPVLSLALPLLAGAVLLAASPASTATAPNTAGDARTAPLRLSIGKAMALLNAAEPKFERQATCASCHNQVQPMVAAVAIRSKGMPVDESVYQHQLAASAEVIRTRHDYSLFHNTGGGAHAVTAPILVGLAEAKFPADENTDAAVLYLMAKQSTQGDWPCVAVRFPHGETTFDITAEAVRAIDLYAPPAMRAQADASIAKARAWMVATPATSDNDALVNRLKGLSWAKAGAGDVGKATAQLIASQKPDGGWSQRPSMASDAYATGDSLLALYAAGMKPSHPAYQRGLAYLLKTQAADGSWYVKAHALPIQPPIDAGFPYGRDQWISAWATAYAATAMAYAL